MPDRYQSYENHPAQELGRIAHEGTLGSRQSAIAELVRRAKRADDEPTLQERLTAAQNTLVAAYGRIETLEGKLRRIRGEASA